MFLQFCKGRVNATTVSSYLHSKAQGHVKLTQKELLGDNVNIALGQIAKIDNVPSL